MDKLGQAFFVSKQIPILKPTLVKAPAYSIPIRAMQNGAMWCKSFDGGPLDIPLSIVTGCKNQSMRSAIFSAVSFIMLRCLLKFSCLVQNPIGNRIWRGKDDHVPTIHLGQRRTGNRITQRRTVLGWVERLIIAAK